MAKNMLLNESSAVLQIRREIWVDLSVNGAGGVSGEGEELRIRKAIQADLSVK